MQLRLFAIIATTVIVVAALIAVSLHPESWEQVLTMTMPTVSALLVLVKVQDYHIQVNSRMDELMSLTAKASKAEGNAEGRAESRLEAAEAEIERRIP